MNQQSEQARRDTEKANMEMEEKFYGEAEGETSRLDFIIDNNTPPITQKK